MDFQKMAKVDLIKELGIDRLEPEKQEEVLSQIGEVMQQRIVLRLIEEMREEDREKFKRLLEADSGGAVKIEEFLKSKVPNFEKLVIEEVGKYKNEIMDVFGSGNSAG